MSVTERAVPDAAVKPPAESAAELQWQTRLLPFLQLLIGAIAVFFLLITLYQLDRLQNRMADAPTLDLQASLAPLSAGSDMTPGDRLLYAQWRTLAQLENNALERRYHQANVILMARTWTRYLGFVTGMIMALIGAGFILGKFRETTSALSFEGAPVKAALSTASPGLALAALGSLLMFATIIVHNEIQTIDSPMYVSGVVVPADDRPEMIQPRTTTPPTPDSVLRQFLGPAGPTGRR